MHLDYAFDFFYFLEEKINKWISNWTPKLHILRDKMTNAGLITRFNRERRGRWEWRNKWWKMFENLDPVQGLIWKIKTKWWKKTGGKQEKESRLRVAPGRRAKWERQSGWRRGRRAAERKNEGDCANDSPALEGSVVHSILSSPLSHLLMLIFITLLKILIIN